jgi:hypothetical protein
MNLAFLIVLGVLGWIFMMENDQQHVMVVVPGSGSGRAVFGGCRDPGILSLGDPFVLPRRRTLPPLHPGQGKEDLVSRPRRRPFRRWP